MIDFMKEGLSFNIQLYEWQESLEFMFTSKTVVRIISIKFVKLVL